MKRARPSLPLLIAALAPRFAPAFAEDAQSTVSVYVPGYRSQNWNFLAGSAIASDSVATTYTIFCPNTDDCEISGPLPFTFAEGPSTFEYSGTLENKLTAIISCQLASTTAATCTEYTSFGAGFTRENTTGPTEVSLTETYSGTDVQWGVLTLTSPVPAATTAQTTGDGAVETINPTDTAWFFPSPTTTSWAAPRPGPRDSILSSVAMIVVAGVLAV